MWVSKAKQKKEKKRGDNQENSRFFISSNHRRARLQAPLCKRLRLGASVLLKKKVMYGKLSVQARGPNHPSGAAFLMSHCLSLGQEV